MVLSYNWLREYLPVNQPSVAERVDPEKLSKILTSIGLEVESMHEYSSLRGGLKDIVSGKIISCEKHPDADKLKITKVDVGNSMPLQIVCGASNAEAGQNVLVALTGATLYPINGEPFPIKKAKIRGVESQGMICAEDEIGLSNNHDGIMVLPGETKAGTPAAQLFNVEQDVIFEIGLTPNRVDAMSHLGVARDVCAYLSHHLKKEINPVLPFKNNLVIDNQSLPIDVTVLNNNACPRYSGVSISGITVTDSPKWLQQKLLAIGLKPINNIVDITNFVLHETGQPLHAFDADKIKESKIIVRNAAENELFISLDNKERKLSNEDLVISGVEGAMCIAGVYGGINSGVTVATKNIFLESANFNPGTTRKTSLKHGLRTDAAVHFEKGIDISQTVVVLKRAAALIKEIAGGKISSNLVDVYPSPVEKKSIGLKFHYLKKLSGKNYHGDTVKNILQSLGFELVKETSDELWVNVPLYKTDISIPADLVEEIMRIDGLDNVEIPSTIQISPSANNGSQKIQIKEKIASTLAGMGLQEIFTNSITNSAYYSEKELSTAVKMINNLSTELDIMRPGMLHSGLEVIAHNHHRKQAETRFFEFGKIYSISGEGYKEENRLCVYVSGHLQPKTWNQPAVSYDFFFLKGLCEKILHTCSIQGFSTENKDRLGFEYGAELSSKKQPLAYLGKVDEGTLRKFQLKQPVFYLEMMWDEISSISENQKISFREISKFPMVNRDLALVVNKNVQYNEIDKVIKSLRIPELKNVQVFDIFESEKLGPGKKSVAVNFTFLDHSKTLTDAETENMISKLVKAFETELEAEIRK